MRLARLQCLLVACAMLAGASVPCDPTPEWVERGQTEAEMPCHREAHAAHAASHHDVEWKAPCPCGCSGKAMPSARGGRLGFALALAPQRPLEAHRGAAFSAAMPRLPQAPTQVIDPVPI